ncbi:MAG: hypothetical protein LUH18_09335 [Oscillospiraceae bacterium]|nr:hypothetical protein [Oscillospiraceae bacterium]
MEIIKVNEYTLEVDTTIEELELDCNPNYAAIITYGKYVFFTDINCKGQYIAVVYEFLTPNRDLIDPIRIKTAAEATFPDSGHAIEWCFQSVK